MFSRLSYFDEVHGVIYIASLNGYNLKIEEDNTQNRLIESINLFYILASSSYFANTPFILFLNKTDLFRYVHTYYHYFTAAFISFKINFFYFRTMYSLLCFNFIYQVRGHSTTTWTNFDPILTPSSP